MKSSSYNTVDVKVGSFIRGWVIATYQSDVVKIDKYSNLWGIVKQSLELLPNDYHSIQDRSEYISFVLTKENTRSRVYDTETEKVYHSNSLYRCYISETGCHRIQRYLEKQFKAAFRTYMVGACGNNTDMSIQEGITQFLLDYNLQEYIDKKMLGKLQKDWYRYRQNNPDTYSIPIFF